MTKDIIKLLSYADCVDKEQNEKDEKLIANRLAEMVSQRLNELIQERIPDNLSEFQVEFIGIQEGSEENSPDSYTFNVKTMKDRQGRLRSEEQDTMERLIANLQNQELSAEERSDILRRLSDNIFFKDVTFYVDDLNERALLQKTLDKLKEFKLINSAEKELLETEFAEAV